MTRDIDIPHNTIDDLKMFLLAIITIPFSIDALLKLFLWLIYNYESDFSVMLHVVFLFYIYAISLLHNQRYKRSYVVRFFSKLINKKPYTYAFLVFIALIVLIKLDFTYAYLQKIILTF